MFIMVLGVTCGGKGSMMASSHVIKDTLMHSFPPLNQKSRGMGDRLYSLIILDNIGEYCCTKIIVPS